MAGMLAAMRWRPDAAWVFVACDLPRISPAAVQWLLSQRAPGVWAILPRLPDGQSVEPLFACYEPRARQLLEESRAPSDLAQLSSVITPEPPPEIAGAWANMNTPIDVARFHRPPSEAQHSLLSENHVRGQACQTSGSEFASP